MPQLQFITVFEHKAIYLLGHTTPASSLKFQAAEVVTLILAYGAD